VARSLGRSVGAIHATERRARAAGLTTWAQVEPLTEVALEAALYRRTAATAAARPVPDGAYLHVERRKPGVADRVSIMCHANPHRTHPAEWAEVIQVCRATG
jgi:hypothetical protein